MATATSRAVGLAGGTWGILRADERRWIASAGLVFALASGGAAMSAAAGDAMFLSRLGPAHLGEAVAASSALLAIVLAVVGGLADRVERRRVLASLAVVSAAVIAALAALSIVAPRAAAGITLIGGKQLAAATDLAFWVVIAERLDARRSRRLLPLLAATGGIGAALGAVLVVPIAAVLGARGILVCAAVLLALAGAGATRLPATRRVASPPARLRGLVARSWRDGARAVRRNPLARHLAVVVGAAGVFASLAYFALGVSVAAQGGSTADFAALLGGVRGAGQLVTLGVQLVIAPRLLARLGTGYALLLAPLFALAAGLGLVIAPVLAVAIATQVSARVLDAGIETPAEKLTQTLLPGAIRGRVAGFLDGTAKRAGAVLGGLIAAALAGVPAVFYAVAAIAAALWLLAASRIARELPALAIEHVSRDADPDAVVDDRAVAVLERELAGDRPERAAEVLARLHGRGRIDAVGPLARAATARGGPALWRALIAVLDLPAEAHGKAIAGAILAAGRDRLLAVRALGLAGGVAADATEPWRASDDPALALTATLARLRLTGDSVQLLALLGDALRGTSGAGRAVILDELAVEVGRALAGDSEARVLEVARHLVRALRRGGGEHPGRGGESASRAVGFAALTRVVQRMRDQRSAELALLRADVLELARDRVETAASPPAPAHMLTSLIRLPGGRDGHDDLSPEVAAALRLYGSVLEGADVAEAEDLRRIARALGEPDDDVRAAAEAALAALGPTATGELIATAAWGRRRARDRAAALLAELPVTAVAIDRLIDAELDALDRTYATIAVLIEPGDELLARRLDERLGEIAHTVLLLVAASRRSPAIARAAVAWRHARGGLERARTLAVIEAALPRALVGRLVEAVDELTPADRAMVLVRAGVVAPARDAAIRAELAGRDRLARALVLHILGAAGRSAHRDSIASAARAEAIALTPRELIHKLSQALDRPGADSPGEPHIEDGGAEMPSRVETLIALGRVPLLASLTTRQLADVAERARWSNAREGSIVVTGGDVIDALIVVEDGELAHGDRRIVKGEVVDELACVAPVAAAGDLRVVRAARLIRLERVDFEELVDDVPGLAAAVCRALGERARRAEDGSYRSPLASRG
jgi:MFS family permease